MKISFLKYSETGHTHFSGTSKFFQNYIVVINTAISREPLIKLFIVKIIANI